jgi:tetratricopeptide (TPR) repeat protein
MSRRNARGAVRERHLDGVLEWVKLLERTNDPRRAPGRAVAVAATTLAKVVHDDDVEAHHALGWFHWYRSHAVSKIRAAHGRRIASKHFGMCVAGGFDAEMPEQLLVRIAEWAAEIAATRTEHDLDAGADVGVLARTIRSWKRIIDLLPAEHVGRTSAMVYLAITHGLRYEATGCPDDLDQAIATGRPVLERMAGDPRLPRMCANVSSMFLGRVDLTGDRTDLEEAIMLCRRGIDASSPGDPDRLGMVANLSNALRARFAHTKDRADLDASIDCGRQAVHGSTRDPDHHVYAASLGAALWARFERFGDLADIDEAVELTDAALAAAPHGHAYRPVYLHHLGSLLLARFERVGALPDLVRGIDVTRAAVAGCPPHRPERPAMLSSLGAGLRDRFERLGDVVDLDAAIEALQASVSATPSEHQARHKRVMNLSAALRIRFDHTGASADLGMALEWARVALTCTPTGHLDRPRGLHLLASILHERFTLTGAGTDLEEAVESGRRAVAETPDDHPMRAEHRTVLSNLLMRRSRLARSRSDLDEAIDVGRQAVRGAPEGTRIWASCQSNLALALRRRFDLAGDPDDLDHAISSHRAALAATSAEDPVHAERLLNLGESLLRRDTSAGPREAAAAFLRAFEQPAIRPEVRISAAASATALLVDADPERAARLMEAAVRALPEAASRRLEREDQQNVLSRFGGVASHAAALALATAARDGEPPATRALRLLELGRGVMLAQTLDSRSDLTHLRARHPETAERFTFLRDRLNDTATPMHDSRQRIATEFGALLEDIRRLDGFESFLLPPQPEELVGYAEAGPIVVLNVSKYRSDAIMVTANGISALSLPELSFDAVRHRGSMFRQALDDAHDADAQPDRRADAQNAIDDVLGWLWDSTVGPVLDHLGFRSTPADGEWPQMWWVPVGITALLPIHAAGHHRMSPGGKRGPTAMDRVISSYTPTIRALRYARERGTRASATGSALIVAMPTTPGIDIPLRHATREADAVRARLSGTIAITEQVPTKPTVLARLSNCMIAHFACHGRSDPANPSHGSLLLHDHDTNPLTVADIVPIDLAGAQLAYLSACHTAVNSATNLADEAIHLTTAFLLAGYPHVIGTLWEIDDPFAVAIADKFYGALITATTIDTTRAARALHHVTRAARNSLPRTPSLWAAFIHTGA